MSMEYASNGKANAGLTLGIIGTSLAGLLATQGGVGGGYGIFGGNQYQEKMDTLKSEIAELRAMRYSDQTSIDLYKAVAANAKEAAAQNQATFRELYGYIAELSRDVALTKQAGYYEGVITNNKIDCCCNSVKDAMNYNRQISELADASILSYVNSTFIPGVLKLGASNICNNA